MPAIFRNSYQRGLVSILFSAGSNPLQLWDSHIKDGSLTRLLDPELKALVLDLKGVNVSTTYIVCPKGKDILGIHMPFMVMIVKNLKKYWTFEVTIRDETNMNRRFRVSNFQSTTCINPCNTAMPIGLSSGWNQIQFNLADFTQRAYNKQFMEVVSVKINANIRIRRIYFADRLMPEDELPNEYRLFVPIHQKQKQRKSQIKENVAPVPSSEVVEISTEQPPPSERPALEEKKGSKESIQDQDQMASPSKTGPSQHEMKSPSKTGQSQHEMKSPSKTGASQHAVKSPSKTGASEHAVRPPSKIGASQHAVKSQSKMGASEHEMKSQSKTGESHHEIKSSSSKTGASEHEMKSPSKTTSSHHKMKDSHSKTKRPTIEIEIEKQIDDQLEGKEIDQHDVVIEEQQ